MATAVNVAVGPSTRPDPSRTLRRDQSSRQPPKVVTTPPSHSKSSTSSVPSRNHFGFQNASNKKSGSTKSKNPAYDIGARGNVAQPAPNTSTTVPSSAVTSASNTETASDYLEPSPGTETPPPPSLVSASSISSRDSPRSNVLRRKPSVIGRYISERHAGFKDSAVTETVLQRFQTPDSINAKSVITAEGYISSTETPGLGRSDQSLQPPLEFKDATNNGLSPRKTPVSEPSTTPSLTFSASPSQYSHTTDPSFASHSPRTSSSPFLGMRPFTPKSKEMSSKPGEALVHPFFRQTNLSGNVSAMSFPRTPTSHRRQSSFGKDNQGHDFDQVHAPKMSRKPVPVHPPELAHLNAASSANTTSDAPNRPSRDGTPSLHEHKKAKPVVKSNLPKLNTSQHRRQGSDNSSVHEARSVRSPASQRGNTPVATSSSGKGKLPSGGSQLSLQSMQESAISVNGESTTQKDGSPEKTKSRFGFFSRKSKHVDSPIGSNSKPARKGPAAGTGHEGYGKHSFRLRSGSSSTTGSSGHTREILNKRKSSGASSKASELDDFLQQRLSPVYLRGEARDGESQGRASISTFEEPSTFTPSISTPETAHTSTSSGDFTKHQLAVTENEIFLGNDDIRGRVSIDQTLDQAQKSTLRSPSRRRLVKTKPMQTASAPKSNDGAADVQADGSRSDIPNSRAIQPAQSDPQDPMSSSTKTKKSGWSFFSKVAKDAKQQGHGSNSQRTQPSVNVETSKPRLGIIDSLPGSSATAAHYVPADASQDVTAEDLDILMREAQASGQADNVSDAGTYFEDLDDEVSPQADHGYIAGYPSANQASQQEQSTAGLSAKQALSLENNLDTEDAAKVNAKTAGIPVSVNSSADASMRKDYIRKPTNLSFSRPFARASPRPDIQSPPPSAYSAFFPPSAYQAPKASTPRGGSIVGSTGALGQKTAESEVDQSSLTVTTKLRDIATSKPFLDYSPRKNSDVSYSSSSGTMYFPTATTIAHGPGRQSHASTDETWPEFDDLIGYVLTPSVSASSANSKSGNGRKSVAHNKADRASSVRSGHSKLAQAEQRSSGLQRSDHSSFKTSVATDAPTEPVGVIAAALRDTPSLATLRSVRSNSLIYSNTSKESPPSSLRHKRSNSMPTSAKPVAAEQNTNVKSLRNTGDNAIHENPFMFRYRVLMTSKWLSFGRLLFSPIHDELGKPDDRVLVIDGLGNRDWSYYCAVSYPQTQIYSLGPSASSSSDGKASFANMDNLSNYRHFAYTTPGTDFPFPKGFFAAVVYRFPLASSDAVMRCMVSECKRVLRPGGYLEVSAIDLDLGNMGSQCRRAVRNLKTDLRSTTPEISLRAASDHMQSLIGRRGFENLNRCVVGVPAAGAIPSSRENSQDGKDVDLSGLANDDSQEGDSHITKMVAQVGRWWYTQCYEMGVLPNGDPMKSMWCERNLLRECEELNTTFKLLICYAQKPSCAKRRTVSL
ncbi:MAG: hypothetical protein Q9162_001457 [Coniocarpon cinnabarinum]